MDQNELFPAKMPRLETVEIHVGRLPEYSELLGPDPDSFLIEDIRAKGVVNPIVLAEPNSPHKPFFVYDGRRRIKACRILRDQWASERGANDLTECPYNTLRATVIRSDEPLSADAITVIMNATAKDNVATELGAIENLIAAGYSEHEISEATGLMVGTIRSRLKLSRLIPELREALDSGTLKATPAATAARLSHGVQSRLAEILADKGRITAKDVLSERTRSVREARATLPFDVISGMPSDTTGSPEASRTDQEGQRPTAGTTPSGLSESATAAVRVLSERVDSLRPQSRGSRPKWSDRDLAHLQTLLDEIGDR